MTALEMSGIPSGASKSAVASDPKSPVTSTQSMALPDSSPASHIGAGVADSEGAAVGAVVLSGAEASSSETLPQPASARTVRAEADRAAKERRRTMRTSGFVGGLAHFAASGYGCTHSREDLRRFPGKS